MSEPSPVIAGTKKSLLERGIALLARWPIFGYLLAVVMVMLGALLRHVLTRAVHNSLPTYITFYPAVMLTAILAGFWPGMLATVLAALFVTIWLLPPYGVFAASSVADAIGIVLFVTMGVLMSAVAHLYHRTRERAAETLRQSEERFRLMLESVKDYAIIMLDPSGHVANWNGGAERIKGYRAEEILGQTFRRFTTPEDIAAGKPQQELEQALANGRFEAEEWRVRKDGSRFWASVIITPIYNADGGLFGCCRNHP